MRFRNGKDYLDYVSERIDTLEIKISELIIKLNEERSKIIFIGGASDGDRVQKTLDIDKMSESLTRLEELEDRIDKLIDARYRIKRSAMKWIQKLQSTKHKEVLIDKYIDNLTNKKIAELDNIDIRTVQRRHEKAVEEFCKIYKPSKKDT